MNFDDLIPGYQNGELTGWTCSRCGWSCDRDIHLADIAALTIARAEFADHTCGFSEVRPEPSRAGAGGSYFLLSKVCGLESCGALLVDTQAVREYGTEDEVETVFYDFSLANFADECRSRLRPEESLVFVSKVVSECDELGNTHEIMRGDLKVLGPS
jgi:hypothetical protein